MFRAPRSGRPSEHRVGPRRRSRVNLDDPTRSGQRRGRYSAEVDGTELRRAQDEVRFRWSGPTGRAAFIRFQHEPARVPRAEVVMDLQDEPARGPVATRG